MHLVLKVKGRIHGERPIHACVGRERQQLEGYLELAGVGRTFQPVTRLYTGRRRYFDSRTRYRFGPDMVEYIRVQLGTEGSHQCIWLNFNQAKWPLFEDSGSTGSSRRFFTPPSGVSLLTTPSHSSNTMLSLAARDGSLQFVFPGYAFHGSLMSLKHHPFVSSAFLGPLSLQALSKTRMQASSDVDAPPLLLICFPKADKSDFCSTRCTWTRVKRLDPAKLIF